MEKTNPWLNSYEQTIFPKLSSEEIKNIFQIRALISDAGGHSFNPNYIMAQGWRVLILLHNRDDEHDLDLSQIYSNIKDLNSDLDVYALPSAHSEMDVQPEVELYDPPLISKLKLDLKEISLVRKSMIRIFSNAYLIIPEHGLFSVLNVEGYYSLVASNEEFLSKIYPTHYRASWLTFLEGGVLDDEKTSFLQNMINRLGYA